MLPGGQVFLRATAALSDYEGAAMRRGFGVLAPVLLPRGGPTRPPVVRAARPARARRGRRRCPLTPLLSPRA